MRFVFALCCLVAFLGNSSKAIAGETIELARGVASQQPRQPQAVIDSKGVIHVAYGVENEIRYCRSDDNGKSFSSPISLPSVHAMSLGMRRGPRIAVTDSAICVTAIGGKKGKGRDGDLLALRSIDGGNTWSEPIPVNDSADAAREGLHAMASGPKDSICGVWLDLRSGATEVMASMSTDGGKTWGRNTLVYRSPEGSVCECCHPSVAIDSKGQIFVQWRNSLAGDRDMYVTSSSDDGRAFDKAIKLGNGSWRLNACPMDGGAIAASEPGKFFTVWRRNKDVYLLASGNRDEQLLGTGEQPWIAATTNGPFIVWVKKRGDAAVLFAPGAASPTELAAHANDPIVVCGPNRRGPVVAFWESREGKSQSIQCQVIANVK